MIKDIVAELRKMMDPCAFGGELENNLREQIVRGIRDDAMRRHLIEESELTLDRTVKIITSMEAAFTGAKMMTSQADGWPLTECQEVARLLVTVIAAADGTTSSRAGLGI